MLGELKDKAKKDQLKRLIAMLNKHVMDEDYDLRGDEKRDLEKNLKLDYEEGEDIGRAMLKDKHPREDLEEDEKYHEKKSKQAAEDLEEDIDYREDGKSEVDRLRDEVMKFMRGESDVGKDVTSRKSKSISFNPRDMIPGVKVDAMVAKIEGKRRGRKKKKAM